MINNFTIILVLSKGEKQTENSYQNIYNQNYLIVDSFRSGLLIDYYFTLRMKCSIYFPEFNKNEI